MFLIRPATLDDIDTLEVFANTTARGMVSLPRKREFLEKKIAFSISCFSKEVKTPHDEIYCFVLENTQTHEVVGCCAVYSKTGVKNPVCYYQLETSYPSSKTLPVPGPIQVLKSKKLTNGPAELSMLFLMSEWRKERLGELLSLSRLLFIADHSHRISPRICARLRGIIDKEQKSCPFWEGIGKHFISMEFDKVCELLEENYAFVEEFLPQYPIYSNLLSKETQKTIGATHATTIPALKMLKKQNFNLTSDIDLFDGGPILQADTSEVRAVKTSQRLKVADSFTNVQSSPLYLVSNARMDYRCCFAYINQIDREQVELSQETAALLQVQPGDNVRLYKLDA